MNKRFAAPIASAATAILLLGACGDDDDSSTTASESSTSTSELADGGPTTVAKGEDIELVGGPHSGFGNQTLNIDAVEENGEVTGEFRITDNVFPIECANTDTEGVVIIGGTATAGSDFLGMLHALIIREGDPDSVSLYPADDDAATCTEMLESIPDDLRPYDSEFVDVHVGEDIETG